MRRHVCAVNHIWQFRSFSSYCALKLLWQFPDGVQAKTDFFVFRGTVPLLCGIYKHISLSEKGL